MFQVSTTDISTVTCHLDGNVPPIIVSVILEHSTEAHFLYRRHTCIPLAGRHLKLSIHLHRCRLMWCCPELATAQSIASSQNLAMMQLLHLNVTTAAAEALEMCMMSEQRFWLLSSESTQTAELGRHKHLQTHVGSTQYSCPFTLVCTAAAKHLV